MKNKIHYSPESRRDLDDIWDYIVSELQTRSAAERVIDRISREKNYPFTYRGENGVLHTLFPQNI